MPRASRDFRDEIPVFKLVGTYTREQIFHAFTEAAAGAAYRVLNGIDIKS
jgi:hypothetical protein